VLNHAYRVTLDADGWLQPNALHAVAPYYDDRSVVGVQVPGRMYNARAGFLAFMQDIEFIGYSLLVQGGSVLLEREPRSIDHDGRVAEAAGGADLVQIGREVQVRADGRRRLGRGGEHRASGAAAVLSPGAGSAASAGESALDAVN
jgi:hypothetical protein